MGQKRPLVLLALGPALLADLFRHSLAGDLDLEVVVAPPVDRDMQFDVAVVSSTSTARARGVRARFLVVVPAAPARSDRRLSSVADDFDGIVATIRRLAAAAVAQPVTP